MLPETVAAAFPLPDQAQWRSAVDKVLKGADFEKRLVSQSADGIRIAPLYPAANAKTRPFRSEAGRWQVAARLDHPSPAAARELALADLEGGAETLVLSFAGARAARGYGLVAEDVAALDTALDGVMLDLIRLRLDPAPAGERNARLVAELIARRDIDPAKVDVDFGLDPVGVLASHGVLSAEWPEFGRRLATLVGELRGRGFSRPFLTVDTRPYHEAGASEAQELGAAMATAVAYLRALEAGGMALDLARDAISFTLVADTDEFMAIAKFRAARLLWERVQQACGLEAKPMALHAETAWRSLTRRDPWVNQLRATIASFSAGIGGADSLTVLPFTAALGLPDAFARRVARNTQLILLEEANLWRVADPAAGAGGFEALTQALCEQGWHKFQDLEAESGGGVSGIVGALINGHVQQGLARERANRAKAIATRRESITGTSEFPNLGETSVSVLAVPPVVGGSEAVTAATGLAVEPLLSVRLAEAFETLRDAAEAAAARLGKRPTVFLATLGSIADFTARAGFARNLFEAGGLVAPSGDGFACGGATDLAALVVAFEASGARLACLCGSDAFYADEAAEVAQALQAKGATVWLAGRPGDLETALNQAGVSAFIFAGCDVIEALRSAHAIAASDGRDR
ncbi:methylmalonyl-CoA mutase [Bosea sp. WAO]|uniref:methylmalonyl-CoA mutase subunit beta n=1 Tax=Bosea sp. WAO TaxID=406341 RepID=UPI00074724C8|nr:methylmalonyl-CoA mutase subunit beta [Bosea sp. WAO]KUL92637.1 methylmalonyl-CoA mutase [Bosea sp. WAO]